MKMKNDNGLLDIKGRINSIFSNEKTTFRSEDNIYSLIADHPYFIDKLSTIKSKLGIPKKGFSDEYEAYKWEHANATNKNDLRNEVSKLLNNFSIKSNLITKANFFVYDYILFPKRVSHIASARLKQAGARVIKTSNNLEVDKFLFIPGTNYIEIYPHTTQRDVINAFSKINRNVTNKNTSTQKHQEITRTIWLLGEQGLNGKEIKERVKSLYGRSIPYNDIPVYRLRYEKALKRLKSY